MTISAIFAVEFKAVGGTIVEEESMNDAYVQRDFRGSIPRVAKSGADIVYAGWGWRGNLGLLRVQMVEAGLEHIPLLAGNTMAYPEFLITARHAVSKCWFTFITPNVTRIHNPLSEQFVTLYQKRWGSDPPLYTLGSYAATQVIIAALRNVLETAAYETLIRERIRQTVQRTKMFSTAMGKVSFNANGDIHDSFVGLYRFDENLNVELIDQLPIRQ